MASTNSQVASANFDRANYLADEVDIFTNTQGAAFFRHDTTQVAQSLFEQLVLLASDPFSDIETLDTASRAAASLHPWVVQEREPNERSLRDFKAHKRQYLEGLRPAKSMVKTPRQHALIGQVNYVFELAVQGGVGPNNSRTVSEAHRVFGSVSHFEDRRLPHLPQAAREAMYPWILNGDYAKTDPKYYHNVAMALNKWRIRSDQPDILPKIAIAMYLFYRGESRGTEAPYAPELYLDVLKTLALRNRPPVQR